MNRGIARRPVFEGREDVRAFLACVAVGVRSRRVEVHAYVLMTTHFHLAIRSVTGELSLAMQRIQNRYVRWFNRKRRRDGPLFRGRFRSKLVDTDEHWGTLVRYIDQNPVEAGLVRHPAEYPYGSAAHYARRSGPVWLSRGELERTVMRTLGKAVYEPTDYDRVFGGEITDGERRVVERRIASGGRASTTWWTSRRRGFGSGWSARRG